MRNWSAVVAVCNDEAVLSSTLLRSPALSSGHQVHVQKLGGKGGFPTVATAYNVVLKQSQEDLLVFVHPDVYLPPNWSDCFDRALDWLDHNDPEWGVLGLVGVRADGTKCGFAYDVGQRRFVGDRPLPHPSQVRTLDEFVFVLRRSRTLVCDETFPDQQNHFSTVDLCLQAESLGLKSYALPCFAVHNSNYWRYYRLGFWKCYLHLRKKWHNALPIMAPCAEVTAGCLPMMKRLAQDVARRRFRDPRVMRRVSDPEALYQDLRNGMATNFGPA